MLSKLLAMVVLTIGLTSPALSSPELAERHEFCVFVAENSVEAWKARNIEQMDEATFIDSAINYYNFLLRQGLSMADAIQVIEGLKKGWESPLQPEDLVGVVYEQCMSIKDI